MAYTIYFLVLRTEANVFTVGHYDPAGKWYPKKDFAREDLAQEYADHLNGIPPQKWPQDPRLEKFVLAAMQGILAHAGGPQNSFVVAKLSITFAVATLAELNKYAQDPENYFIK